MDNLGFWFGMALAAAILIYGYVLFRRAERQSEQEAKHRTAFDSQWDDFIAERREADQRARHRAKELENRRAA